MENDLNLIDQLVNEIIDAVNAIPLSLDDLNRLSQESNDMIASLYYEHQDSDQQNLLRDAKRDLESKINDVEESQFDEINEDLLPSDDKAEFWMNRAETAFYAGRYFEAINLYDEVLRIEPNWERARQHKKQAVEYLQTGHIPLFALPPDVAIFFGKAQSAVRVMNLHRAREFFDKAKQMLREQGISRWEDGQKFENELNKIEEAEIVYKKGLENFKQGNLIESINIVQSAADLTGNPLYKDKVAEWQQIREKVALISQKLNTEPIIPKLILQAISDLDNLISQHGKNRYFQSLDRQRQIIVPLAIDHLIENIYRSLVGAENSQSISYAEALLETAQSNFQLLQNFGVTSDEIEQRLLTEEQRRKKVDESIQLAQELTQQVHIAKESGKFDVAQAVYQELENIFPRDPTVIRLGQELKSIRQKKEILEPLLHERKQSASDSYSTRFKTETLLSVLSDQILSDITNRELWSFWEWVRLDYRRNERREISLNARVINAQSLKRQANVWFFASIVTAVILLVLSTAIIWLSFRNQTDWSVLSSLVSLIPILAMQLVYQQAIRANERVDKLYISIYTESQRDLENEQNFSERLQKWLFSNSQPIEDNIEHAVPCDQATAPIGDKP
jgi:tetratricopeptide (TPR) repeat protein